MASVRVPSGEQALLGGDEEAGLRLAAVVLADHLGYTPCLDLIEAFAEDWPPRRGEFMWPAAAIDGWLSASAATRAAAKCSGASLDGTLARVRRFLRPPAHHPMSAATVSTRGAV